MQEVWVHARQSIMTDDMDGIRYLSQMQHIGSQSQKQFGVIFVPVSCKNKKGGIKDVPLKVEVYLKKRFSRFTKGFFQSHHSHSLERQQRSRAYFTAQIRRVTINCVLNRRMVYVDEQIIL